MIRVRWMIRTAENGYCGNPRDKRRLFYCSYMGFLSPQHPQEGDKFPSEQAAAASNLGMARGQWPTGFFQWPPRAPCLPPR